MNETLLPALTVSSPSALVTRWTSFLKDRKSLATALKEVYRATDADTAEKALTAF